MTLIYGIDPGQNCGLSIWDDQRSISSMQASLIKAKSKTPEGNKIQIERKAAFIARELVLKMREAWPDFVAVEMPMRSRPRIGGSRPVIMGKEFDGDEDEGGEGGGSAAMISSNQIVGAIAAVCAINDIPFVTIAVGSWRSRFFDKGFKPPLKKVKKRDKEIWVPDWKTAARERCALLGITVTNHDMAEACGIAFAATATPEFKMLRHQKEKAA